MNLYFLYYIKIGFKSYKFADKLNRRHLQHHTFINILVTRMITFIKTKKSVDQTNSDNYRVSANITKYHIN